MSQILITLTLKLEKLSVGWKPIMENLLQKQLNKLIENAPSNVGINRRGKRFYGDVSQRSKRSKSVRPNFYLKHWWQWNKNAKPKSNYSGTKWKREIFLVILLTEDWRKIIIKMIHSY